MLPIIYCTNIASMACRHALLGRFMGFLVVTQKTTKGRVLLEQNLLSKFKYTQVEQNLIIKSTYYYTQID